MLARPAACRPLTRRRDERPPPEPAARLPYLSATSRAARTRPAAPLPNTYALALLVPHADGLQQLIDDGGGVLAAVRGPHHVGDLIRTGAIVWEIKKE